MSTVTPVSAKYQRTPVKSTHKIDIHQAEYENNKKEISLLNKINEDLFGEVNEKKIQLNSLKSSLKKQVNIKKSMIGEIASLNYTEIEVLNGHKKDKLNDAHIEHSGRKLILLKSINTKLNEMRVPIESENQQIQSSFATTSNFIAGMKRIAISAAKSSNSYICNQALQYGINNQLKHSYSFFEKSNISLIKNHRKSLCELSQSVEFHFPSEDYVQIISSTSSSQTSLLM